MNLSLLEKNIDYEFKNKTLLINAITHSSLEGETNYENLEFLGDSILGFLVAKYLYQNFSLTEGDMSKTRSKMVSEKALCKVANSINLSQFLRVGSSYKNMAISKSIYADVIEAIIAAIYLDSDMETANKFVMKNIIISYENITNIINENIDYKTMLQEKYQEQGNVDIQYLVVSAEGKSNDMTFTVKLSVNGVDKTTGVGKSKREAEQNAAKAELTK